MLGPSRKKNKDFVSNIFKSAKESGAEVVESPNTMSRPSGSRKYAHNNITNQIKLIIVFLLFKVSAGLAID